MSDSMHIVCPHCDAVNRVPGDRLKEQPSCGKCSKPLFTGQPVALDAHRFVTHTTRSDIPVLVDFWAEWCGPCRMMAPAFEEAARQLEPDIRLVKLNTEEAPEVASQFTIRSIPTLALIRDGKEIARHSGAIDAGRIVAWAQANYKAHVHAP
jgi:thioredoxin 2